MIVPGSTEEIQAIVKVCNRYKVKFKAHCTGFGPNGMIGEEGFLSIDLRRMDRILEIDEKNMYAVVEPYVSLGALTLEAIRGDSVPTSSELDPVLQCSPASHLLAGWVLPI